MMKKKKPPEGGSLVFLPTRDQRATSVAGIARGMEMIFQEEYNDLSDQIRGRIEEIMSYQTIKKQLLAILEKK
jgi:hypothetical protein